MTETDRQFVEMMAKDINALPITVVRSGRIKSGDTFTIAGAYRMIRNPDRRWWQVWKPRFVRSDFPSIYTVVSA